MEGEVWSERVVTEGRVIKKKKRGAEMPTHQGWCASAEIPKKKCYWGH